MTWFRFFSHRLRRLTYRNLFNLWMKSWSITETLPHLYDNFMTRVHTSIYCYRAKRGAYGAPVKSKEGEI